MCFASQHEIDTTYSVIGAIIFIIILVLGLGSFSVISTNIVHINSNNNFNNNNFNNNYFPSSMVLSGVTYYCNNQGICDPSTSSSFTQSTQSFPVMILFVLFVFIFIFIGAFIYIRSQSNKNIDNAFKLKKNVDSMNKPESSGHTSNLMQSFVPLYQKKKEISKIQYYECGTELSLEDKFCPNCGEDTKDELKTFSENNFTYKFILYCSFLDLKFKILGFSYLMLL